ncbi:diacylglycerol O-acyltransferase 3 [Dendrobium catenatum]|uniref:Diacylglycerol O-acyltransferase 3, cytosolic n=1 Tax=Dendrobium catenatum TaxID=906689 RepID=A0A2I0V7F8_9ASPA|nr:diacylglycerol O-acyltransferase 3 [Dendrobium catenatum]PKU59348.1 hypothetical protein MA16_Dca023556 [Dendrobium catenatum]
MEVSSTVIRQSVSFLRGAGESSPFSSKRRVIGRQRSAVAVRPWSDEGHRLYYALQPRCGGVRDAKRKEEKKRAALVTELSRDLAALYSTGLGMDGGEGNDGEVRGKMIKEAAELLLAQLNQLKTKEKETKKRKKEEKAALKAAKMRDCTEMSSSSSSESSDSECEVVVMNKPGKNFQEVKPNILDVPDRSPERNQAKIRNCAEMSSSSSSSESSDSECEVVVLNKPEKNLQEIKPNILDVPDQSPVCKQAESSLEIEVDEKTNLNHTELKLNQELSSINCMNNAAIVDCSGSVVAVAKPLDKIEVCMGGKCKKSGAIGLLQELEKKVGIEGAVVGCKCMGKCKEGPNVRIVSHYSLQDELGEVSKKPLCIGVGLEDVSVIVANFLGEKNIDMGLYGA